MTLSRTTSTALAAATFALLASSASSAQTTPTPPPSGPALAGVCVLSKDKMLFTSLVGKAALTRLQQIKAQITAELNQEESVIQSDAKALTAQHATLAKEQFDQRASAINQRQAAFQAKVQQRQQELAATQEKAFGRIGVDVDPVLRQAFVQKSCSILIDSQALIYPAPAMDITDTVVRGLDAKIQTITFDREHLDAAGAGAN
jgi:Skp family chaperone for outer membrane proteins